MPSNLVSKLLAWLKNQVNTPLRVVRTYLIFAIAHTLTKILYVRYKLTRHNRKLRGAGFPGKGLDMLGTELAKNFHRLHGYRSEYMTQYDSRKHDFVSLPSPLPAVMAWSPRAIEMMLKTDFDHITKPSGEEDYIFNLLKNFIGEGIFVLRHGKGDSSDAAITVEHENWFKQRKTTSLIFTKGNFNSLIAATFEERIQRFVEMIHQHIDENDHDEAYDMEKAFFSYTMDSVQSIFYGRSSDTLGGRDDVLAESYDTAHLNMMKFMYKNIGQVAVAGLLPWPFAGLFETQSVGTLALEIIKARSPEYQIYSKSVATLDKELRKTITELRQSKKEAQESGKPQKKTAKTTNLVSLYLDNPDLTDDQLRGVMGNLIIAGRDTTACTLTWAMFQLTQHPEVQEKLYQELTQVLSSKNGDRLTIPTHDDLHESNMPYLNAVVYETLRLHPAIPENIKVALKDVHIDGRNIPAGTRLCYSPYAIGRDPNRYPEPEKFDPERWIPFKKPTDYEFPVFQGGPRFCLGRHMAMYEMKLVLSVLVQEFTFKLKPGELSKVNYTLLISMSLSNSEDSNTIDRDSAELLVVPERREKVPRKPETRVASS